METKQTDKLSVAEAQYLCLRQHIPFYSYRLPGKKEVHFGAQCYTGVSVFQGLEENGSKAGFVIVPFDLQDGLPQLFIRPDLSFIDYTQNQEDIRRLFETEMPEKEVEREGRDSDYIKYEKELDEMLFTLRSGVVNKVVLAHSLIKNLPGYEKANQWFGLLTQHYPEAFVFLVSVPGIMTWMGATPELFMRQTPQGFRTMALAGTQALNGNLEKLVWGWKEREEQQFVTDYIRGILTEIQETNFKMEGPFSASAGNVAHLCTTFKSERPLSLHALDQLRELLHPTPAVGGFPKKQALQLIREKEACKRRYYAGYLGPVEEDGTFEWFVNLRCMELFPDRIRLYAGGGITALSVLEKEWYETEMKAGTLLNLIQE